MPDPNPSGLYWLGPLLWSLAWAVGLLAVSFLVAVLSSPRARRNRAKLRSRR